MSSDGSVPPDPIAAELHALGRDYLTRLPAKVEELASLVGRALDPTPAEDGDLTPAAARSEAAARAHALAGSAGSYGLSEIGEAALALETALLVDSAGANSRHAIRSALETLRVRASHVEWGPA